MAQPPATADHQRWVTSVLAISRLPAVGSEVYYLPGGHAEQYSPLPVPLGSPPFFPCSVAAVELFTDRNDPYAIISLIPGPPRVPAPDDGNRSSPILYYHKPVVQADTNRSYFNVPKVCADFVFPGRPAGGDLKRVLHLGDLQGRHWECQYEHDKRILHGWAAVRGAKLSASSTTNWAVLFMRRPNGEVLVEIRSSFGASSSRNAAEPPRDAPALVPHQEVADAARLAAGGTPFKVSYYPRPGRGEFVVPRKEVDEALLTDWAEGMQVRTRMEVVDAKERGSPKLMNGTVTAVHASLWRKLQIEWDDSTSSDDVNIWQVDVVEGPALKKRRIVKIFGATITAPLQDN